MSAQQGAQLGQELATVPFDQMIKNLLLAMVAGQNSANQAFISGVQDLAGTQVTISYTPSGGGGTAQVTGNALAFGILPVLLEISNAVITIKMDMTLATTSQVSLQIQSKADFWLFSASVNAKYQNSYSFSADASSSIEIHVSPSPPPKPLMDVINAIIAANPIPNPSKAPSQ